MDDDLSPEEWRVYRERRKRNIALALMLGAVAVLFFLMSVVKFGH